MINQAKVFWCTIMSNIMYTCIIHVYIILLVNVHIVCTANMMRLTSCRSYTWYNLSLQKPWKEKGHRSQLPLPALVREPPSSHPMVTTLLTLALAFRRRSPRRRIHQAIPSSHPSPSGRCQQTKNALLSPWPLPTSLPAPASLCWRLSFLRRLARLFIYPPPHLPTHPTHQPPPCL